MLLANTEREAHVLSVADYIVKRKCKFLTGYINSQNSLCNLLCRTAQKDLSDMTLWPTHIACDIKKEFFFSYV